MCHRVKCSLRQITARAVVALTASAVLASCSPTEVGVSKLDNYVKRLSTASKTPVSDVASARITQPPVINELPGKEDADTLTLIDFLALSGCKLQANIAKRNTTMGRNASVSQRLIFDLEFIRLAPACIDKLRSDEDHEIADLLEASLVSRTESLVHTLARGVLGGSEWREFWRIPDSLGEYPLQSSGDAAQSLWELSQRVKRFLNGTWSPSDENLEPLLAKVRVNAGGQLLRAAMIQARGLTKANRILRQASEAGMYCSQGKLSEAGTISKTVVAKYFAGDVQAWSAAVAQRHYEINSPIIEMEAALTTALSDDYLSWAAARDLQLGALFSAPRQHVSIIQAALDNC